MPLLDFKCKDCGYIFDELVRSSENIDEVVCPKCAGKNLMRVYEGKCYGSIGTGGGGCTGHCATCSGCKH